MTPTRRTYQTSTPASAQRLYDWHASDGTFERLSPPWQQVHVEYSSGTIRPGDRKRLRIPVLGPLSVPWELVHREASIPTGFVDEQVRGPFRSWRHEHRFVPSGDGHSILEDRIEYTLPFGSIGDFVAGRVVASQMDRLFEFRHARTEQDLERLGRRTMEHNMRVAITGSTGLVGTRLVAFLRSAGHEVVRLVRHPPKAADEIEWNPSEGTIDKAGLEGVDAVVHLAGVSIAGGLWTAKRKGAIRDSRVDGTRLLAETLASLDRKPSVLVSTSAVGYYGDAGDQILDEDSPNGDGFMADVVRQWEEASRPAADAGIRVVNPRFGLVFAGDGGMLPLVSMPFKFGVGGALGDGSQWMSWIALDDLVGVLYESITNTSLSGPVNATAPEPVTNETFTRTMGKVLSRPTFFRVPEFVLRTVGGQLSEELLLVSQRAVPSRLEVAGFRFNYPDLESALRREFGKSGRASSTTHEAAEQDGVANP